MMNKLPQIKFAVVGMGWIGRRHADLIGHNSDAELVACCDINDTVQCVDPNIPLFTSIEALLSSGIAIDAVSICTPNGLHAQHCIQSLQAGCAVVCEKPVALTAADAAHVQTIADLCGKQVFCVMQNRFSPTSVWLKEIVKGRILGAIFMVHINCFWNRDARYYKSGSWHGNAELDGGTLFTQFSHFIDALYWIFGDITNIYASFKNFSHQSLTEFEDSGTVMFDLISGGIGSINYSTSVWDTNLESSITVIGAEGSVKISGQYMDKVEICRIKDYTMPLLTNAMEPTNNHRYVIQNAIDTLRGIAQPAAALSEGIKVVEIIERIYSHKQKN